jgi:hypothetical protein
VTARLTCPEGTGAGDLMRIARGGSAYDVTVPEGVVAGQTFQVQLPAVAPAVEGGAKGSPLPLRAAASGTGYGALLNSNSDPLITCTAV